MLPAASNLCGPRKVDLSVGQDDVVALAEFIQSGWRTKLRAFISDKAVAFHESLDLSHSRTVDVMWKCMLSLWECVDSLSKQCRLWLMYVRHRCLRQGKRPGVDSIYAVGMPFNGARRSESVLLENSGSMQSACALTTAPSPTANFVRRFPINGDVLAGQLLPPRSSKDFASASQSSVTCSSMACLQIQITLPSALSKRSPVN